MPYPGVPASLTSKVERCVNDLMKDPKFTPKDPKQGKKSAAIAVCVSSINKSYGEFSKVRAFAVTGYFEKGESRIIEGVASTINPDLDGEQMSKEALETMMEQIKKSPIPLRSEHSDNWDDELGEVFDAYMDGSNLRVKAKLLKTSKANDLWERIKGGAKLGLSVAGRVVDAGYEICESLGKEIKTFKDVVLKEISVTSKPANTMTWLNVIAKSVNFSKGENMAEETEVIAEETPTEETPTETTEVAEVVEETEVEKSEEVAEEASPAQEVPEEEAAETVETEEAPVETDTEEVAKAGRKFSAKTAEEIRSLAKNLMKMIGDEPDEEDEEGAEHEAEETPGQEAGEEAQGDDDKKTKKSLASFAEDLQKSVSVFTEAVLAERAEANEFVKSVVNKLQETEARLEKVESLPLQRKGIASPISKAFGLKEDDESIEAIEKSLGRPLDFREAYTLKMNGVEALKKSLRIN